jgi:hypothetical protein
MRMKKAIQIDKEDNVATVTDEVNQEENLEVLGPEGNIILRIKPLEKIIFGHKIALKNFIQKDEIIKYGEVIGVATTGIEMGEWIHTHNVESGRLPTRKLEESE